MRIKVIADGIGSDGYRVFAFAARDKCVGLAPIAYLSGTTGSNPTRTGTYTFHDGVGGHADSHS